MRVSGVFRSSCVLNVVLCCAVLARAYHLKSMPKVASTWQASQNARFVEVAVDDEKVLLKSRLPQRNRRNMTPLEVEFRQLLEGILYTDEETESVLNSRFRTVLRGIAASYYERPVYRAFEVLYEDYIPLRIAGRLVYQKLRDAMEKSKAYQLEQLEAVTTATGMSFSDAKSCWSAFVRLTESQELPTNRLKSLLGPRTFRFLDCDDVDMAMAKMNPAGKDSLSFGEVVCGLHLHGDTHDIVSSELLAETILRDAIEQMGDSLSLSFTLSSSELDKKRQQYNKRYDDMLKQFGEWKEFIPDGEGRRLDILRGCFVGSENEAVVEALRIIYVDYRALRLSGDWIFHVVSTLIRMQKRNLQSKTP
jgi:hypothetical protein